MPTPPPTWDSGAAFWQHSAPDDRLHGAPPSYYNARAQPQLSSSPPQSITTFPRLTAFDQRCFGPPWGADQSASSCCESGRMSPSTTRFQDPQCSIPLIPDGDRIDEDGYSNTGIHVTVRHGLPHYRTPSSINYSDTASNQEAPATRVSPAGTSMQRHVRTGTFHWDWKKSEQQEYKDVL
ncbi:hypothetical protein DQ04_01571130 [Trypanosoma grayi]|uniref:hypothetical protein n=1 Tax=Trypanosoma grayi TaxID=71804 RepID=UPI0004F4834C|nr:hypothetical protein DQ04_01571130 [Trypanosoma grayi]KEG12630.1 hypothetical protein DQ04_01571130 [Trypanosoma grayi]